MPDHPAIEFIVRFEGMQLSTRRLLASNAPAGTDL